jgi:O-Antigen ligase
VWLSGVWSRSASLSLLEGQRDLVYVGVAAAAVLFVDARTRPGVLAGVVAAAVAANAYGFVVEVLPELAPAPQRIANLAEPIGYPNAMGLLAAMGALLGLTFAVSSGPRLARGCGGGAFAVLVPCLYLALARGPWLAFALGLATAALLVRSGETAKAALALLPLPAASTLAVALVPTGAEATGGTSTARFVATAVVCGAALGEGLAAARLPELAGRFRLGGRRLALAASIPAVLALVVAGSAPMVTASGLRSRFGGDLGQLLTLSGHLRGMYWAAALRGYEHHPLLGSGAGTFEQLWLLYRPTRVFNVLDAHNAYLEVLAELGPVGLASFLAAVSIPLVTVWRAPRTPSIAGAAGAYVAYAAHIAVDWDWELPAVTVAALLCASTLVAGDRRVSLGVHARLAAFVAACAVAALSLAGLLANGALWKGRSALDRRDFVRARAEADKAGRWDLWSVEPLQLRGETAVAAGEDRLAAALLRRAARDEPNDYRLWIDLAAATTGPERRAALARAHALNPRERPQP